MFLKVAVSKHSCSVYLFWRFIRYVCGHAEAVPGYFVGFGRTTLLAAKILVLFVHTDTIFHDIDAAEFPTAPR